MQTPEEIYKRNTIALSLEPEEDRVYTFIVQSDSPNPPHVIGTEIVTILEMSEEFILDGPDGNVVLAKMEMNIKKIKNLISNK